MQKICHLNSEHFSSTSKETNSPSCHGGLRENYENIELFWVLFNKAYKVVAGDDTLHNRKGWCMVMAGANMNRFQTVFGDDVLTRIRTCKFHFKESRNKMKRKLNDDDEKVMSFETKC